MQEVIEIINSVGFPIACTCALFWYMVKQRESHKEETAKMAEAINNNTLVMQQLLDQYKKEETNHEA